MLVSGAWDHGVPRGRAPGRPGGSTGGGWQSSPPPPTRSIPPRTWNCLSAGLSPARAAAAVATTSSCAAWRSTASLLSLGVDADRAWRELAQAPGLGELAALARSSHHSGAGLSNGCSRIAARLRDDGADHATAEAERAGVLIALPMTLCYLPAFFLLGLAPMVISLGTSVLSSH